MIHCVAKDLDDIIRITKVSTNSHYQCLFKDLEDIIVLPGQAMIHCVSMDLEDSGPVMIHYTSGSSRIWRLNITRARNNSLYQWLFKDPKT